MGIFKAISLVEWPERLGDQLVSQASPSRLEVSFEGLGPQAEGRTVVLSAVGPRWQTALDRWQVEGGLLRARPSDPLPDEASSEACNALQEGSVQGSAPSTAQERDCKSLPADPREWRILGVESSCDDTGAAVLTGTGAILGEAIASQAGIHEVWGGVVPRLAQEEHRKAIDATVEEALRRANVSPEDLTAVAVTVGPGLGLCLEVGVRKALQIAAKHRLPLVRVHHMEAHTLVTRLPASSSTDGAGDAAGELPPLSPAFPFVTLLVSGGHNLAVLTRGIGRNTILGSTIDDSIGEAFDKTARLLGITQVPGGPHLEKLAKEGNPASHSLPRPLSRTRDPSLIDGCDFSFSGLKTAVRSAYERDVQQRTPASGELSEENHRALRADVAAAFQSVAVSHLCERAGRAVGWALELEPSAKAMVVAGGVAANQTVREGLRQVAADYSITMTCPPPRLCVDNGVMVAWAGIERLRLGLYEEPPTEARVEQSVEIRPRWPLGQRDARSHQPKFPKGKKRKVSAECLRSETQGVEAEPA